MITGSLGKNILSYEHLHKQERERDDIEKRFNRRLTLCNDVTREREREMMALRCLETADTEVVKRAATRRCQDRDDTQKSCQCHSKSHSASMCLEEHAFWVDSRLASLGPRLVMGLVCPTSILGIFGIKSHRKCGPLSSARATLCRLGACQIALALAQNTC